MVSIGPGLGKFFKVEDKHINYLDEAYARITKANKRILVGAQKDVSGYLEKMQQERAKALEQQTPKQLDAQKLED
jgi:hypothetical protein